VTVTDLLSWVNGSATLVQAVRADRFDDTDLGELHALHEKLQPADL
jgi:hypothetical protein